VESPLDSLDATAAALRATLAARTRTVGAVQFCVANVSAAGLTYTSAADIESCDAITK